MRQANDLVGIGGGAGSRLGNRCSQNTLLPDCGGDEDALVRAILPIGNAAVHETAIRRGAVLIGFRVIHPEGFSCRRIDGSDLTQRGTGIQDPAHHKWSRFIGHGPEVGIGL